MRALASIGFALALINFSAGTLFAAPTPFVLPQSSLPLSMRLPLSGLSVRQRPRSATVGTFYSFGSAPDGQFPEAGLIDVNGVLYGTTHQGGKDNFGTVFAVTAHRTERVLYSFSGGDGKYPFGGLFDMNGILYGTTSWGGTSGWAGSIFSVAADGAVHVLHEFGFVDAKGRYDGGIPLGNLIDVNGLLYGTTSDGGSQDFGTVFTITPGGTENVLYNFGDLQPGTDGVIPYAGLINVNGVLYGTTEAGGTYLDGTVFAITTAGVERVLHNFGNGTDGVNPVAALAELNGILYGTTESGGKYGKGTVFTITTAGTEHVIHNFGNGADGIGPEAALIDVNGVLYGTTSKGGEYGEGTIFSITASGSEHVLRDFRENRNPASPLIDINGVLYGTAPGGGAYHSGGIFFQTL